MMTFRSMATVLCASFVGLVLLCPPLAKADVLNRKTEVTFNAPFRVPGRVLPAGTYVFKLMDSPSDRNIVQIYNSDESQLYATILAISDYRMDPTGKTVIKLAEGSSGGPEAIKAWFYPGDLYGEEFVYPNAMNKG